MGDDIAGKEFTSSFGGEKFDVSGESLLLCFSMSALTFGIGNKLRSPGESYAAGNIIAKNLGEPAISAYFAGGSYNVEANTVNALIGVGTELLSNYLTRLLPS